MAKEKIDVVIDNVTYKNIDVTDWRGTQDYDITTSGIAQIIKQFVKNNFGDIKVWAKSSSYSGGSSVNVYLWKVPQEWYDKVNDFAERFGMYNEYDGGDGIWRGRKIGATTVDGKSVGNYSPYMDVSNNAPWDSKERDMTPPNYAEKPTPKKKEYERKGSKFSPTENLDLVLDCGNGWKIYVGKPKGKYLYNVVKDKDTKQNKEQWAEIKADMLEAGFMWAYKSGTFQRWTTTPDDTIPQKACNVLSKYWGGSNEPKEEAKDFNIGDKVKYIGENTSYNQNGDIGVITDVVTYKNGDIEFEVKFESKNDKFMFPKYKLELLKEEDGLPFYVGENVVLNANIEFKNKYYSIGTKGTIVNFDNDKKEASVYFDNNDVVVPNISFNYIDKYSNGEKQPKESKKFKVGDKVRYIGVDESYIKNGDVGTITTDAGDNLYDIKFPLGSIYVPASKIELVEEQPRDETPKEESSKIPLVKIIDVWGDFGTPNREFTNYEDLEKEFSQMEVPESGYDKYKFKFEWADGSFIIDRIDMGQSGNDFNPIVKTFEDYIKDLYTTNMDKITVMYEYEMKEPMWRYSTEFKKEEPKESKDFKKGDKVRLIKDISNYKNNQGIKLGDIGIVKNKEGYLDNYDVEFDGKEIYLDVSYFELVKDETLKQEVDLDTYISDLNMLLELEEDADKKFELAIYINDLNTLKLLE